MTEFLEHSTNVQPPIKWASIVDQKEMAPPIT